MAHRAGEVRPDRRCVRELECAQVRRHGRVDGAHVEQDIAEVVVRLGEIRPPLQRSQITARRILEPALRRERIAELVARADVGQRGGAAVGVDRAVEIAQGLQRAAALKWMSPERGRSSLARRKRSTASSRRPWARPMVPRLLWASARSGAISSARP
jgi:hypothetical protein